MKRVALISEHASPLAALGGADGGGQNVYVAQIAQQLAARGYDVDIFTRRDQPDLPAIVDWTEARSNANRAGPRALPRLEGLGRIRLIHVPAGPAARIRKEELLPYMEQFTTHFLGHCDKSGTYDLIHANFFMSALVAIDAKRRQGTPVVVTFHALGRVRLLHHGGGDGFPIERLAIEDRVVAEADAIVAECPQDMQDLRDHYGADADKVHMVPCGFDEAEFGPVPQRQARAAVRLDPDERIVLQLGRLVPRKGVDTVVRSLARLRDRHGIAARLVIVGGETRSPDPVGTPEISRLHRLAVAEDIADAVTFVGSRNRAELRDYYCAADVFVTTPWYEPFGITPVEAMACGTPVIGAAVGGIKFTVVDGETGFLVPPNDPDAIADRLAQLFRQPQLLRTFGQKGLDRARRLFTWKQVTDQILTVYETVLNCPKRRAATTDVDASRNSLPVCRAVFVDKDGTLIENVPYNVNRERVRLLPGAIEGLSSLHRAGFRVVVVTNQSGVARGLFSEQDLVGVASRLRNLLAEASIPLAGFYYCPHYPGAIVGEYALDCECRKPAPGLLRRAAQDLGIDLSQSWCLGDILDDIEAGRRAGCRTILINNGNESEWRFAPLRRPDFHAPDLAQAATIILSHGRTGNLVTDTARPDMPWANNGTPIDHAALSSFQSSTDRVTAMVEERP